MTSGAQNYTAALFPTLFAAFGAVDGSKSRDVAANGGVMGLLHGMSKIRVRLVVVFTAAFLGMALFGALSYQYFGRMEQKLVFLSQADNMLNTALEARRYEKNYFLYHHEKDFEQARAYLAQYQALLASEREHITSNFGAEVGQNLESMAQDYGRQFSRVHQLLGKERQIPHGPALEQAVARLRDTGKQLLEISERIAQQERQDVSSLLREYGPLLAGFLVGLGALGALAVYILITRLVKPLQTIEEATDVVGQGQYQTIPWEGGKDDEIASLVQGFNRMVGQLRHNNEQMVQTEKLTALGTLTSGVAHELNNPLNNISTSCQILLEELDQEVSPYHRELLAAVDQQVSKARDIVGSLLEFARQREFELKREDLRTVVEEALKLIRGEIPASVQVRVEVPKGLVLEIDRAHMIQALLNLIMNSIQAMPDGGLITLRGHGEEGGQVVLEVQDNGQGIPPEVLPRIFDPFFTTKDVGRGTGLGLSITYGIVERHQGHIQAESLPEGGALFRLSLPPRVRRG